MVLVWWDIVVGTRFFLMPISPRCAFFLTTYNIWPAVHRNSLVRCAWTMNHGCLKPRAMDHNTPSNNFGIAVSSPLNLDCRIILRLIFYGVVMMDVSCIINITNNGFNNLRAKQSWGSKLDRYIHAKHSTVVEREVSCGGVVTMCTGLGVEQAQVLTANQLKNSDVSGSHKIARSNTISYQQGYNVYIVPRQTSRPTFDIHTFAVDEINKEIRKLPRMVQYLLSWGAVSGTWVVYRPLQFTSRG